MKSLRAFVKRGFVASQKDGHGGMDKLVKGQNPSPLKEEG